MFVVAFKVTAILKDFFLNINTLSQSAKDLNPTVQDASYYKSQSICLFDNSSQMIRHKGFKISGFDGGHMVIWKFGED